VRPTRKPTKLPTLAPNATPRPTVSTQPTSSPTAVAKTEIVIVFAQVTTILADEKMGLVMLVLL
jgi:hypothetical protein